MRSRRGTEHCGGRIGARLGCSLAAPRWGDSQHHASTTARHAAARAMFMENRRCNCTCSLRRSILIFTTRACGADWRQALAGSTLRSSARGRRGPVRSRGTVAEVCPRSGSIRSTAPPRGAPGFAARERRASRPVASVRPCLQHSRRRRVSLPRTAPASSGSYQCQCLGQPKEHIRPHAIDASSRRAVA